MKSPEVYEIQVEDRLGSCWSTWFEGLSIDCIDDVTILVGPMDQATLHGVLLRVRDLGLILIAVNRVHPD